jgi:hypothetical protein
MYLVIAVGGRWMISKSKADAKPEKTSDARDPSRADEAERPQPILVSSLAKWALPSITVFVAIIGYIVQSAQQDMLGIGIELGETTTYFISAAKFMSDTARLVAAPFLRLKLYLGDHGWLIGVAALITLALLLAPRFVRTGRFYRPVMLTILLVGLLGAKFLILDVPLARVTNVVLGNPTKIDFASGKPLPIDRDAATASISRVDKYAESLRQSIRCSRINPDMASLNVALQKSSHCKLGMQHNSDRLIGIYNAHIWMMALIVIAAGMVLHFRTGRLERMLALLGILYSLSIPYAYGKLIVSAVFDFGIVHLTPAPSLGEAPGQPPRQPRAIILSRGSGGASILVVQQSDCPRSDPNDPTRDARIARQWIPQSRIASIEEIYSTDVIKWTASNERSCPD